MGDDEFVVCCNVHNITKPQLSYHANIDVAGAGDDYDYCNNTPIKFGAVSIDNKISKQNLMKFEPLSDQISIKSKLTYQLDWIYIPFKYSINRPNPASLSLCTNENGPKLFP